MVLGQVQKLFPEQKALIQIGQATLVAQLETAIKGNESYWFTVKRHRTYRAQVKGYETGRRFTY